MDIEIEIIVKNFDESFYPYRRRGETICEWMFHTLISDQNCNQIILCISDASEYFYDEMVEHTERFKIIKMQVHSYFAF